MKSAADNKTTLVACTKPKDKRYLLGNSITRPSHKTKFHFTQNSGSSAKGNLDKDRKPSREWSQVVISVCDHFSTLSCSVSLKELDNFYHLSGCNRFRQLINLSST